MNAYQKIISVGVSVNESSKQNTIRFLKTTSGKFTQYLLIVVAAFLIGLDIYLVMKGEKTISEIIHNHSYKQLFVLSWIWGILTAHLFLARLKEYIKVPEWIGILILILTSGVLIFIGYKSWDEDLVWGTKSHIIFLFSSGCIGYFLWPQEYKS